MPEHAEYATLRQAYWDAQSAFRHAAIAEIQRLMPEATSTVVLVLNDTPRLSLHAVLDNAGADITDRLDEADYEAIDMIANDMEAFSWEEADSFLLRSDDDVDRFIIKREED